MDIDPIHTPIVPAAEWRDRYDGTRELFAPCGDSVACLEPPGPEVGRGFLDLREPGHAGAVIASENGLLAMYAVLSRWFHDRAPAETIEPVRETPEPPAEMLPDFISESDPMARELDHQSMTSATLRGARYHHSNNRRGWVREGATHQAEPRDSGGA